MQTYQKINDSFVKKELRKTFSETRKLLSPFMDHIKWGDLKVMWWIKPERNNDRCYAMCYPRTWRIRYKNENGRRYKKYINNLIIIWKKYNETNGIKDVKNIFKHELLHLIAKDIHGTHFKSLAMACNAPRYAKTTKHNI